MTGIMEIAPGLDSCSSKGKGHSPRTASTMELIYRIRYILLLAAILIIKFGIVGASAQFIMISFFAERHGKADCEEHPSSEPCRMGAADLALYYGVSNGISHGIGWIMTMWLGLWSDSLGRRPIFQVKTIMAIFPGLFLVGHVFFNITLWIFLVLMPLVAIFDIVAVFLACMTDLVPEPQNRAATFGILLASVIVMAGAVLPFAGLLPTPITVVISLCAGLAETAYIFFAFPETAPKATGSSPMPSLCSMFRTGVDVFSINSFMSRMACVLALCGLSGAGLHSVLTPYMTSYLGFTKKSGVALVAVCGLAVALTLGLLMKPVVAFLGEVRAMRLSLVFSAAYPLLVPLCAQAVEFTVLTVIFVGPIMLQFPVINAIKSNLVGADRQGVVQGALAAVRVIAVAFADVVFGWFYRQATSGGAAENKSAALPPLLAVAGLSFLALAVACTLPDEVPIPEAGHDEEVSVELQRAPCSAGSGSASE